MGARVGGKRKRGAEARSEQDKFAHKSGVVLQREAKKVRAFQVRKVVQQLKQTRAQLEAATRELETLRGGASDGTAAEKKSKQVNKMRGTVAKLENELAMLKALDLKAVVARAMETTGLAKQRAQQQALAQQQQQQGNDSGSDYDSDGGDDSGERYGRRLADESGDDDDGFDSEEYERARKPSAAAAAAAGRDGSDPESGSDSDDSDSDSEQEDASGASIAAPTQSVAPKTAAGPTQPVAEAAVTVERPQRADEQLQTVLIDRILAHKQMKPLLEAIEKVLEKDERELEKKLRRQEKKALKRERNEVLIGGRSAAAPTSLFLGSLSGRGDALDGAGGDDDDGFGMASGQMAGAEDDIAEFLGETKKKKNRMGQLARRQKALRMEEAAKRKQDRENGIFRPYAPRKDDAVSKYGPSERPKKKKVLAGDSKSSSRSSGSKRSGGKPEQRRGAPAPSVGSRERGAPTPAAASSSSSSRRPPAPPVEASHPSWIAKQALKEKQKASLGAFSGKKITFGDD